MEEGGETYFNRLDLAVKPKKGRALVWPSVLDDNPEYWDKRMYVYLILLPLCVCVYFILSQVRVCLFSVVHRYHEARDVIKGKKLAANHWIHLNDYHTPNHWGCTGSFA